MLDDNEVVLFLVNDITHNFVNILQNYAWHGCGLR